jgi:hypothetical protein
MTLARPLGPAAAAGVPLEAELLAEVLRVQRDFGFGSRAAAMRYLMRQGLLRLQEADDAAGRRAGRTRP